MSMLYALKPRKGPALRPVIHTEIYAKINRQEIF